MSKPVVPQADAQADAQPAHVNTTPGVGAEEIVSFPEGLPGFESSRRFVVVSSEEAAPFRVLQAIEPPHPSFLAIDPSFVLPEYRKVLSRADRVRLGAADDEVMLWLGIVTLSGDGLASVNLRAPIVINPRLMTGFQVMPHQSLYPLRHPLSL